jgi:hypothetical protein
METPDYFRDADYGPIIKICCIGGNLATAAAPMTDATFTSRPMGSAWPSHFNQPIAHKAGIAGVLLSFAAGRLFESKLIRIGHRWRY